MERSCWLYAYHNRLTVVLAIATAVSLGFDVTFILSRSTARVLTFDQISPIYCFGKSFVSPAQELPKSTPNRPLKEYRACPNLSLHLYQNRLKHFHLYPTPLHLPPCFLYKYAMYAYSNEPTQNAVSDFSPAIQNRLAPVLPLTSFLASIVITIGMRSGSLVKRESAILKHWYGTFYNNLWHFCDFMVLMYLSTGTFGNLAIRGEVSIR